MPPVTLNPSPATHPLPSVPMTIHLNCTNCSAPLEASGKSATVRCTYCDSVVLVPEALRPQQTRPQSNASPAANTSSSRQP
ncbi:MAG: hypothetical protein ACRC1H_02505, partial [Caldilineaceae bacterium]